MTGTVATLWPLWLALAGATALCAVVLRRPLRRALRVARACATDQRLPRPLRWCVAFGLLPIPGPVDDAVLILAALALVTIYRPTLRAILAESR